MLTASPPNLTEELLALATRDVTDFLTVAPRALADGAADNRVRLVSAQRLAELGLLRRAAAELAALGKDLQNHPGAVALVEFIQRAGPQQGYIPWSQCTATFAANLAAAAERYAWARTVETTWREARRALELHRTRDGRHAVWDTRAGGRWQPVFAVQPPQPAVADFAAQLRQQVVASGLIGGAGHGAALPWLHVASQNTLHGSSPRIYQVEASWEALAVAWHLADWTAALRDPRVHVCAGPDALAELQRLMQADEWNEPPAYLVAPPPWDAAAAGALRALLQTLRGQARAACDAVRAAVNATYAGRDVRWWARRFAAASGGGAPPLRVLAVASRFTTVLQYTTRDALAALAELGCQTHLLIEPTDEARTTPQRWLAAVRAFEPDLVLLPDHMRSTGPLPAELPVLTWIQDRLPWLFSAETGARLGPLDFVVGLSRDELVHQCGYPAERFLRADMPASTALGDPDWVVRASPPAPEFVCDVAYASNWAGSAADLHAEQRAQADAPLRRVLDAAYAELTALAAREALNGALRCRDFLNRILAACHCQTDEPARNHFADNTVRMLADRLLREQTVTWAAEWAEATGRRLHLYGKGWDTHPRLARYARGFVPHGPPLGQAFRGGKVHLHAGCNTALHQRVLDGCAAGGFFLIRRHGDDVSGAVCQAMYDHARQQGWRAGLTLCRTDLAPPADADYAAVCQMQGLDPDAPIPLGIRTLDGLAAMFEEGTVQTADRLWPDFDRVTFGTAAELAEKLSWSVENEEPRRALAAAMRERVLGHYGYCALMERTLAWITQTLNRAAGANAE